MQDCSSSIANALELLRSCTKQSKCKFILVYINHSRTAFILGDTAIYICISFHFSTSRWHRKLGSFLVHLVKLRPWLLTTWHPSHKWYFDGIRNSMKFYNTLLYNIVTTKFCILSWYKTTSFVNYNSDLKLVVFIPRRCNVVSATCTTSVKTNTKTHQLCLIFPFYHDFIW